ncbi:MAG: hypothetical protein ACLP59_34080 [Bryobacteraceae bacterium]
MWHKRGTAIVVLLVLAWSAPRACAEQREQRQIAWEGLSAIVGQKVRIAMPDGARIEGRAAEVQSDALAVEIAKTSNKAVYPKGRFLVPRATLRAVDVERSTTHWSILTISVSVAIGAFLAVLAVALHSSGLQSRHPAVPALAAGAVGVPVAGIVLGRKADRRTVTYIIKP